MSALQRTDINDLKSLGYEFSNPNQVVDCFEQLIAEFFNAPYAVTTDCCTHGLELCIRMLAQSDQTLQIPKHTYMSVPMTCDKLGVNYKLVDNKWNKSYQLYPLPIIDAATVFERNYYVRGTLMVVSFQFKKHLPIGRGGIILTDNYEYYQRLQRMSHDGRTRGIDHADDNIQGLGFHYYMTPEDAARGILLFFQVKGAESRKWSWQDYTDLTTKDYFKNHKDNSI